MTEPDYALFGFMSQTLVSLFERGLNTMGIREYLLANDSVGRKIPSEAAIANAIAAYRDAEFSRPQRTMPVRFYRPNTKESSDAAAANL